jgi:hypothetical protein
MWFGRFTEPRLQTAISSLLVFKVISVHRFELWTTPDVLLRAAQVARVFEGEPWVAGFKQHGQHFTPQVFGLAWS